MLERNALQTRSLASSKRLETELRQRLTRDLLLNKLEGSDQQREKTTRIKQKNLPDRPNIALKIESH